MEFLGFGIFGRIDVTFRSLAFKKKITLLKSNVIAMAGYKTYCHYPAFSACDIALDQVMLSNKLYVFFQKVFRGKLHCGSWDFSLSLS